MLRTKEIVSGLDGQPRMVVVPDEWGAVEVRNVTSYVRFKNAEIGGAALVNIDTASAVELRELLGNKAANSVKGAARILEILHTHIVPIEANDSKDEPGLYRVDGGAKVIAADSVLPLRALEDEEVSVTPVILKEFQAVRYDS